MSFPRFYNPEHIGQLRLSPWSAIQQEAGEWREQHPELAASREKRVALFGIDCQVGFCTPGASLYVPGAEQDMKRGVEWLYRNLESVDQLFFSLDTHHLFQIFHADWWEDEDGAPPPPLTPITVSDIHSGRWIPRQHPEASLEYCEKLEAAGKYVLTIWPYHTLLGSLDHALLPDVMEAACFHSFVHQTPLRFLLKGEHPQTENYSVLSPEVTQLGETVVGKFEQTLFEDLLSFDRVYVFGEAKSHCVLSTLLDLKQSIETRYPDNAPQLLGKFYLLEDAMSPVPAPPLDPLPASLDFPRVAEAAFQALEEAGMHRVDTTTLL